MASLRGPSICRLRAKRHGVRSVLGRVCRGVSPGATCGRGCQEDAGLYWVRAAALQALHPAPPPQARVEPCCVFLSGCQGSCQPPHEVLLRLANPIPIFVFLSWLHRTRASAKDGYGGRADYLDLCPGLLPIIWRQRPTRKLGMKQLTSATARYLVLSVFVPTMGDDLLSVCRYWAYTFLFT